MRWAFQIKPLAGELLSGYLCRAAFAHGASPYGFCALHFEDNALWARDIDRGAVCRYNEILQEKAGLSLQQIRMLTLDDWLVQLTPADYRRPQPAAVTPWVNAVGVFHRIRRQHALQFCPGCLTETGVIQKQWRLSFIIACERHQVPLLDGCPRCDAPFVPHRATGRMYRCYNCHEMLATARHATGVSTQAQGPSIRFQQQLYEHLTGLGQQPKTSPIDFDLVSLRDLSSVFLCGQRAETTMDLLDLPRGTNLGTRLEFARNAVRTRMVAACCALVKSWPESFRMLALKFNFTQRRFAFRKAHSPWLAQEISRLPSGGTRSPRRRCGGTTSMEARISKLGQEQPHNWRASRAALMFRAVHNSK